MSTATRDILEETKLEREYQDEKWGTEFDDKHTLNDWSTFVSHYLSRAGAMNTVLADQRENLLKATALLVAAIEAFDRNDCFAPRHYEDRVPNCSLGG